MTCISLRKPKLFSFSSAFYPNKTLFKGVWAAAEDFSLLPRAVLFLWWCSFSSDKQHLKECNQTEWKMDSCVTVVQLNSQRSNTGWADIQNLFSANTVSLRVFRLPNLMYCLISCRSQMSRALWLSKSLSQAEWSMTNIKSDPCVNDWTLSRSGIDEAINISYLVCVKRASHGR